MVKAKKSVFWKIYFALLGVAVIALVIFLIWLHGWLEDFEMSEPVYVAEQTFNDYFKDFNPEEYLEKCELSVSSFDTKKDVVKYLNDITADKEITYAKVSSGVGDSILYNVKAGDVKFATFKLVPDDSKSGRFTFYKADEFSVIIKANETVTVDVPVGYKVFLNGIEVSEDYISENNLMDEAANKYLPEGLSIKYKEYKIENLLAKPLVTVKDAEGKDAEITQPKDGLFKAGFAYDETLKKDYNDWILKGMERYAAYMQHTSNNPVSFNEISVYFDPSSDLYEDIRTSENMFVWDYEKWEYVDEYTGEYIKYDEKTFSCVCRFDQVLTKGTEVYHDYVDVTLYLRQVGDDFLIYGMSQNAG